MNLEEDDIMKPVATMLIGHQYTGKSTFIRSMLQDTSPGFRKSFPKIYNLDEYVKILLDGKPYTAENWQSVVKEANKELEKDFQHWLKNGYDIIFDRTNTTKNSRMKILRRLKNYSIDAVVFPSLTDDEIRNRMLLRPEQHVPFDVVVDFRNRIEEIDDEERRLYRSILKVGQVSGVTA